MANIFKVAFSGNQEVPPIETPATATGSLQLNEIGDALSYNITVKGFDFGTLLGIAPVTPSTTDDVVGLHFHVGARGTNGAVVFGIANPTQDTDDRAIVINPDGSTTITGIWEQTDPANQPLSNFAPTLLATPGGADTNLYLNIHTNAFSGGELRGQLVGSTGIFDIGTENNDNLIGAEGDDTLFGRGGNDLISGNNGDDLINGNQGSDTIDGGIGNDSLFGGQGDDFLFGKSGNDVMFANIGNDSLSGGEGDDLMNGNQGNDTIDGNAGNDIIYGGQEDDLLIGSLGSDYLSGDKGNDILSGVDGSAASPGQNEVDILVGGEGADRFNLANNLQFYYVGDGNNGYAVIADFNPNEDRIQLRGGTGNYVLGASPNGLPGGTAIFQPINGQNDLVAIVQGTDNLNLGAAYISYV
ncbi:MAG TPA: CHRD domain-containing protein [Leptolyngbyaceae cyanobacterium]